MRKMVLCVLAAMLWLQAVNALTCFNCRRKNCLRSTPCPTFMEKCITIIKESRRQTIPIIMKKCSTEFICEVLKLVEKPVIRVTCCDSDRCNH